MYMKVYKPSINEWLMIIIFLIVAINGFTHMPDVKEENIINQAVIINNYE